MSSITRALWEAMSKSAFFYLIFGKRFMDYLFKVLTETGKAIKGSS